MSFVLLLCIGAMCCISMDLALAIIYRRRSHYAWTGYLIVLLATSLGAISMELLNSWSSLAFSGLPSLVLNIIWHTLFKVVGAFLLVFIPYFTTWIIAHPWRQPYKSFFFTLAGVYLVLGFSAMFFPSLEVLENISFVVFFFDIFFCIVVMLKNRKGIDSPRVRTMCTTVFIVAFAMLPILLLGVFFGFIRLFAVPLSFLAFSITIMVFLFLALDSEEKTEKQKELSLEDLALYHITEREFSVITLITKGMTNKEIAAELSISVNTVNNHIANVFSKTGVRSRIDLLNLIKEGW